MIFSAPWVLLLLLPWLLGLFAAGRYQGPALSWIEAHVDPRFRSGWTRHGVVSGRRHMKWIAAMGGVLLIGAAGPRWVGGAGDTLEAADVLLVIDASASMNATDVGESPYSPETPKNRFQAAKALAAALVEASPDTRFGLLSFSGVSTLQVPLTDDRAALLDALDMLEVHNFYQSSGSNLRKVLETVIPYAVDHEDSLQVLLMGDGEIPEPLRATSGAYEEPVRILADRGVPVHGVTFGSLTGENRLIFYFPDVIAKKEEKKVLREFTTKRVDRHFEDIAYDTGGWFGRGSEVEVPTLQEAIERRRRRASSPDVEGETDLAWYFLVAFGLMFLVERLFPGPRRPQGPAFRLDALGEPDVPAGRGGPGPLVGMSLVLLGAVSCGGVGLLELAHRANEQGIALDVALLHGPAQGRYVESRGFGVREQIPTYNQARSAALAKRFAEAHDLYQRALELDPELAEAMYNDGHNFFAWGRAERDPRDCDLARTLDLWTSARDRFSEVSDFGNDDLADKAEANYSFMNRQIRSLEDLIEKPPAHCGGGSESEQSSQDGGGQGDPPPPSGAEDPSQDPAQSPPPPPGSEDPSQDPPPSSPPPGAPPSSPGDGASGSGTENYQAPLNPSEQEEIRQAMARIAEQGRSDGRYHRKSTEEQFSEQSWKNPEDETWW